MTDPSSYTTRSSTPRINADTPLTQITFAQLLAILRGTIEVKSSRQTTPEASLEATLERSNRKASAVRKAIDGTVAAIGASPPEVQVSFLRELIKRPDEQERFMTDPIEYSRQHGVLLDPQLVEQMVGIVLFQRQLDTEIARRLGPEASVGLLNMRDAPLPAGFTAAVSSAAQAVKVMMVMVSSAGDLQRLAELKGIGARGITLPGGLRGVRPRQGFLVANTIVAVYGATAVGAATATLTTTTNPDLRWSR